MLPEKIYKFYNYFTTGRFAAADVYDGENASLNSGLYRPGLFAGTQDTFWTFVTY